MDAQRMISFDRNAALIGSTTLALVDELVEDDAEHDAVARTPAQALDIDGVTHLRSPANVRQGDMVQVHIVDALDYDLVAEVRPVGAEAT